MEIEVQDNNLYYNGTVNEYSNGESELLREKLVLTPLEGDDWVTVREGHTLDGLAEEYFGKYVQNASKLWWIIADANDVFNPLDLSEYVGTKIFIPNYLRVRLLINKQ